MNFVKGGKKEIVGETIAIFTIDRPCRQIGVNYTCAYVILDKLSGGGEKKGGKITNTEPPVTADNTGTSNSK